MSVTLRKRKNDDKSTTLYLDIYDSGSTPARRYEFLNHLKLSSATTPDARQKNKENLELAKRIEALRAQELSASDYNVQTDQAKKVGVLAWMKKYIDSYKKKDLRNMNGVYNRFVEFLKEENNSGLLMKDFTETIVLKFRDDLEEKCKGEGGKSYYARFRKMVKQAMREKILNTNPCLDVKPPKGEAKKKDFLTFAELQQLVSTHTQSKEVRRAFIFCTLTGLRWIDAKNLKWESVDLKHKMLKFTQAKTGKEISVPLSDNALELLGKAGGKKDFIFELPTANGANKVLKLWAERAKINKKITWHCARHSFGTNLIHHGTSVYTTSKLLGHSTLAHTERYVRASEELNKTAIANLPSIKL